MNQTRKLMMAAMLAALTCVATMVIKIPSPLQGYLNLGDCVVLCCGWMLGPGYGFLAAAIGSALADVFSGYALYAPATFLIKGLMAVVAWALYEWLKNRRYARIVSGTAAECLMVGGYLLFEGLLYGFGAAAVNVIPNGVQGLAGLVLGILLAECLKKNRIMAL